MTAFYRRSGGQEIWFFSKTKNNLLISCSRRSWRLSTHAHHPGRRRRRRRRTEGPARRASQRWPRRARASQPRGVVPSSRGAGRRLLPGDDRRSRRNPADQRALSAARRPVRGGDVARGSRAGAARRHHRRPARDEPGAARRRGGSRRDGAGGRHAPAAREGAAEHRADVSDRSGRRRHDWRHGGDEGVRHDRGALRHDARERARP